MTHASFKADDAVIAVRDTLPLCARGEAGVVTSVGSELVIVRFRQNGPVLPFAPSDLSLVMPDGWFSWPGGACPVPEDAVVEIKTKRPYYSAQVLASKANWAHEGSDYDIVAYRIVPQQLSLPGVESDPHGTPQHAPGAKLDAGKIRAGLVLGGFARALREVSAVGTYGANKYTPNGWMQVPNGVERYTDAMHRHLLSEASGEACDPDTEILHAAHAAWNALARLDLMIRKSEEK